MQPDHKGQSNLSKAVLAKIHIAKKALCLDDDAYRDILERITGHRSSADIEPEQLPALQREFRRLGWRGWLLRKDELPPLPYTDCDNRPGRPSGAQLRKLEVMFGNIRGYADTNPKAALRAFLQNRCGVSDMKLLDKRKYEVALSAVKRLQEERGVKREWKG